ncbi:MAG: hypothetical protein MUC92_05630 [Fimbriimonadaceae bacterium]|nr:hypothetical protein [Fimbriimonadaceae bacterium]
MKPRLIVLACAAVMAFSSLATADDLLGKGKGSGGGGGGNQSGGGGGGGSKPAEPPPTRGGNSGGNSGGNQSGGGSGLGKGPGNSGGSVGNSNRPPQTPSNSRDRDRNQGNVAPNRAGSDELLGRRGGGQSRSGSVSYGTRNNQAGTSAANRAGDWRQMPDNSEAATRARQVGEVNRGYDDRYRSGYVHYHSNWNDDYFWYPHYQFRYVHDRCVASPFYFYSHLPGYIQINRISWGGAIWDHGRWQRYDWGRNSDSWYGNSRRNDLDYAIEDLRESFRRQNIRYIGNMIPTRGRVTIQVDNNRPYQVSVDDYYDLMRDLEEGTRTRNYTIRDVRWERGQAVIVAEHEFRDAFNRTDRTYHLFGLVEGRRGYEINNFRISRRW